MVDVPLLGVAEVFGTAVADGEGVAVTSRFGLGEAERVGSVAQAAGTSGVHNGRRVNAALAPKAAILRARRVAPRSENAEARTPNTRDAQAKDGAKDQPVRGIPRRCSERRCSERTIKTPQAEPRREPPSVHGASAQAYSWDRAIPSRMSCSLTVTESTAPSVISFRRVRMRA